jgi:diguanylate cyclase (GGDEF)-like protein
MADSRTRLLLVDDDPVVRMITRQALYLEGYDVIEAENGQQALEIVLGGGVPELILLDVVMPVMDGFAFCSWLRAQAQGERVPVLMMTGLDDEASIRRAFEVGATDFITKPVQHAILAQRARFLLRASQTLSDLAESRENLAEAQRIAGLGSWDVDLATQGMRWSDEVYRIFEIDIDGRPKRFRDLMEQVHPDDRAKVERHFALVATEAKSRDCTHRLVIPGKGLKWLSVRCEPVLDANGRTQSIKGTVQDITERRQNEETIRFLSSYDAMTGLPNRLLFAEHLDHALAVARRNNHTLALLHVGLDRFKRINESFGHLAGDALLIQVAERLRGGLRAGDFIAASGAEGMPSQNVARWGGDEFVILLSELRVAEDAARAARRLLDAIAKPFNLMDQEVNLGATAGIALFPGDGDNAEELLKNADAALHHTKGATPGGYGFYTRALNDRALLKLSLESALRKALERQELVPHYQAKVDAQGRPVGAELLLRWRHPELGMLTPDKFIDLAEECNLIVPMGEWVIEAAGRQLRAWREAGWAELGLAINLSPTHFRHPDLLRVVGSTKARHGLAPGRLEIELTEGMLMADIEETQRLLQALKNLGMSLAIDDFGTGYSSLSYLSRFPIDVLKIDRSFIRGIPDDHNQTNITRAIIALAHSLKLSVVAEGVETASQAAFLNEEGCDLQQGFIYTRPLPIESFDAWLEKTTRAP